MSLAFIDAAHIADARAGRGLDLQARMAFSQRPFRAPPSGIQAPPCGPVMKVSCWALTAPEPRPATSAARALHLRKQVIGVSLVGGSIVG